MRDLFITGTDTGVGKTIAAAALLALARARGINAAPMKPIQTGCLVSANARVSPDLEFCLDAAGMTPTAEDRASMACYQFEPACSPHLASAMAGLPISIEHIVRTYHSLKRQYQHVIVEGAGGILVPVSKKETMLDLVKALGIPVVLVARPGLGTLNHTLLSCRELARAGVEVEGIIFNHTSAGEPDYIEADNVRTIRELAGAPVLGNLPFVREVETMAANPADFLAWGQAHLPGWKGD